MLFACSLVHHSIHSVEQEYVAGSYSHHAAILYTQDLKAIGIKQKGFLIRLEKAIKKGVAPLFQSKLPVSVQSSAQMYSVYPLVCNIQCCFSLQYIRYTTVVQ